MRAGSASVQHCFEVSCFLRCMQSQRQSNAGGVVGGVVWDNIIFSLNEAMSRSLTLLGASARFIQFCTRACMFCFGTWLFVGLARPCAGVLMYPSLPHTRFHT